ncbi:MAG: cyclopropane-fatty-acyl-phospholipid synthase family protein [Pirellulales bacterium]|nr:cyclopropane-fatty-acyl-phospholipid synthase family protein [Pirellulales bacterium]
MSFTVELAERGWLPDAVLRWGMRRLLAQRLRDSVPKNGGGRAAQNRQLAAELCAGPIAVQTAAANEQHYEVPARFFELILGPRLKYSGCLYPPGVSDLAAAEEEMLRLTCARGEIADGQRILELGCGWGSLSLWLAEHYPHAAITGVSNSHGQRAFIMARAQARGLKNLSIITADINDFVPTGQFDRVVSVEMFEHLRNHELLLKRIAEWLQPEGLLFVHHFCHRDAAYLFEETGPAASGQNWMTRHFFRGGIMPSADWLSHFDRHLKLRRQWLVDGKHYCRTLLAWLKNLDERRAEIVPLLAATYGPGAAPRVLQRWRMFILACAELFGYADGTEWQVGHYVLEKV